MSDNPYRDAGRAAVGRKLIWFVLAVLVLFLVKAIRAESQRHVTVIGGCDESLWKYHVYKPERLQVHQACVSVTGTIMDATHGKRSQGVRKEKDGDCHGWIRLDAGQEKYINAGNISDEESNLVYEIVCMFPVTQTDAKSACAGYKNKIILPPVGRHVKMTGSWVMDDNHQHWNELHPVSSIEVIP